MKNITLIITFITGFLTSQSLFNRSVIIVLFAFYAFNHYDITYSEDYGFEFSLASSSEEKIKRKNETYDRHDKLIKEKQNHEEEIIRLQQHKNEQLILINKEKELSILQLNQKHELALKNIEKQENIKLKELQLKTIKDEALKKSQVQSSVGGEEDLSFETFMKNKKLRESQAPQPVNNAKSANVFDPFNINNNNEKVQIYSNQKNNEKIYTKSEYVACCDSTKEYIDKNIADKMDYKSVYTLGALKKL